MIDRTNHDSARWNLAQLTGLVPQLTTPSRHHGELVDLWFGVRWTERHPQWTESFERVSNGRRPDPDTPSYFNLLANASSSGLIAARQVSPSQQAWGGIEESARVLVEMVNHDVAEQRSTPPSSPTSGRRGWSMRVRDASSFLFSLAWLGEQKPTMPSVVELPIQVSRRSPSRGR